MVQPQIVIVDYGVGNTYSVANAIQSLGYRKVKISDNEELIHAADALILPGVGAFEVCATNLIERRLDQILGEDVLIKKKPILGICVGMQLLSNYSEENGVHEGLKWIPGRVERLNLPAGFAVPHVGWNNVKTNNESALFCRTGENANFYFDHSYHFVCDDKFVVGYCDYSSKITAAVQKENIFGVQFHPEKSQVAGLKLFRGFFNSI